MAKMLYMVMIDNCEPYEDNYVSTESIWDSYDAALSHIVNDLHFQPSRMRHSDSFVRYGRGDDFRHDDEERATIREMPLNDGDKEHDDSTRRNAHIASMTAGERAAFGLSLLMSVYDPDEVLCAVTRDKHPDEAAAHNTPILNGGKVTAIYYLPLMRYWYDKNADVPMHAIVIDSGTGTIEFCCDATAEDCPAYAHRNDPHIDVPEASDDVLKAVVLMNMEWEGGMRSPVTINRIGTLAEVDEDWVLDDNGDSPVFEARTDDEKSGDGDRYFVDPLTFACAYIDE